MKKFKLYIFITLLILFAANTAHLSKAQNGKLPTSTSIEVFTIEEDDKTQMVTTCKGYPQATTPG